MKTSNLLIVDDTPKNLELLSDLLTKNGYQVSTAISGKIALAYLENYLPDIILLDIKMPEMSGIDAARKIRKFNKTVPIIAQTAFVMAEEKEESIQAGCDHFVTKPLDRTTIMELIDGYFK